MIQLIPMNRIGQLEPYREPPMWQEPVIVPRVPPGAELPERSMGQASSWLFWLGIGAVIYLASTGSKPRKRRRTAGLEQIADPGTLYALWKPKSSSEYRRVPLEDWTKYIMQQEAGRGRFRFVEAESLPEAKEAALGESLPRKRRGRRLYYMWVAPGKSWEEGKTIPKKSLPVYRARVDKGIGKLYFIWAESADRARYILRTDPKARKATIWSHSYSRAAAEVRKPAYPQPEQMTLFSGMAANCGWWDEEWSEKLKRWVWRCKKFAPACEAAKTCITGSPNKLRTCTTTQKVKSAKYNKLITRCLKYSPVCTTGPCLPEPMAKPDRMEPVFSQKEVRSIAQGLAREYNLLQEESGPALARQILDRGGIAPYRGRYLKEEYKEIPLVLRNKKGLPLDEMASEMGLDEAALMSAIRKAYPKGRKTVRRKTWKDFEEHAIDIIMREHREGLRGLGQEQKELWKLKRELVLTAEDPARSDDPLEICLERKGWDMKRVRELQTSISEKLTPDMFTQKTTPLSAGEKELQRNIDACLKAMTKRAGKKRQLTLFGLAGEGCRDSEGRFVPVPQCTGRGKAQIEIEVIEPEDKLKPVREFYTQEVFPNRREYTRSLRAEITQNVYKAVGIPKAKDPLKQQAKLKPYIDKFMKRIEADFGKMKEQRPEVKSKKQIRKAIYAAHKAGGTVPFDLRTLIESGASIDVIRKVYRAEGKG